MICVYTAYYVCTCADRTLLETLEYSSERVLVCASGSNVFSAFVARSLDIVCGADKVNFGCAAALVLEFG